MIIKSVPVPQNQKTHNDQPASNAESKFEFGISRESGGGTVTVRNGVDDEGVRSFHSLTVRANGEAAKTSG